ncbi:uncharacterized protein [Coffea arabica]|uniref:ATP-dependent DNA helicase n=1 Tax=Coffea arabica TaxID=13443 RepID=A0A6P6W209_COFAR|nr:uncharacterized protein LOC113729313 [Coffea arabica]
MSEDFYKIPGLLPKEIQFRVLKHINDVIASMGKNINSFGLVPRILKFHGSKNETRDTASEMHIRVIDDELVAIQLLNSDQKIAFNAVLESVYVHKQGCFFVDGPSGTGKTFLYKALLVKIRSKGDIALATASCGVAASILPSSRIAHSRFKIPIDIDGTNICRIGKQTALAKLLQQAKLIIWDEASMANRICIEAVNDLLTDLMDS